MRSNMEQMRQLELYAQLAREWGADVDGLLAGVRQALDWALLEIRERPVDQEALLREPDEYEQILRLRPGTGRRIRVSIRKEVLVDKLEGALLARFAGCVLGASVENWSVERMEQWAALQGDEFPPRDYWKAAYTPEEIRYGVSPLKTYTRDDMDGVPVDDDITYTLLGLLIAERFGLDFTLEDVACAWMDWLPVACTAEDVALRNLRAGLPAHQAAEQGNPYCQWIGAAIRSDPWAYLAAGWPEKAAQMAYRDAYLTHRRNGIYGEMYLAAAQAAAFVTDSAQEALQIGLQEIPEDCELARAVRWALEIAPALEDWREARKRVDEKFPGMSTVHTINNICLTIFGLILGGRDVTKVLGETVAMGMDNDCTAASAGSVVGALVGRQGIPDQWIRGFHNQVACYLNGFPNFRIDDLVERFMACGIHGAVR